MRIIDKFLSTRNNEKTATSYQSDLRQFAVFNWQLEPLKRPTKTSPGYDPLTDVTNDQWLAITADDIRAYLRYTEDNGLSNATISRHLTAIKEFLNEMAILGLYPEADYSYIKNRIKNPSGKGKHHSRIMPKDQNKLLRIAASKPGLMGKRDYLIVRMLLETGVRRFELLLLTSGNIVYMNGFYNLYISHAKNDKSRYIPITQEMYELITEWLIISGQGENKDYPIFCALRERTKGEKDYWPIRRIRPLSTRFLNNMILTLVRDAGINKDAKITPHSFRVSMITDVMQGGASLRHTQKIAGHADPRLTAKVYDRSNNPEPISKYRKHKLFKPDRE